jgi:lipopolysaccharide transport system permease protein
MEQRIITANDISFAKYVMRVWEYRSLIRVLAKRDLKIRYSQTLFGMLWAVIQPLVAIFIYTIFFYYLLGIQTGTLPYPLFVLPGIIGWFHFSNIINGAGISLQTNPDLIRKVEFPKLVLPLSMIVSGLLEVAITFLLMILLMLIYGYAPTWKIVLLPFFVLINILSGLSIAVWLAALTIRYRDFHHIVPYLVSFGIWLTPVFYPATILPAGSDTYLYLNPVAFVIAGYRWCIFDYAPVSVYYLLGFIPIIILTFTGFKYFYKVEKTIADYV